MVETETATPEVSTTPRRGRWKTVLVLVVISLTSAGWLFYKWQVEPLPPLQTAPRALALTPQGLPSLITPGYKFLTTVATYRDEVFAYLMFDYLRGTKTFRTREMVLFYDRTKDEPDYVVVTVLADDRLVAIQEAADLYHAEHIPEFEWRQAPATVLADYRKQAQIFDSAYNLPVKRSVEDIPQEQLRRVLERYIRFRSNTDPRVRRRIEPVPSVLSSGQAGKLAGDVLTIAEFYSLPLDLFLGIGAMENNYMNVRGDLEHTIWKRRPAKDDIILERRRGRVRVLNDSAGVWQITRETLRHSHRLYLKDERDYSQLPEHLRPPETLDVTNVDERVLTTYAGLLLRSLVDHFNGDISLAIGAYNGGTKNPNMRYQQGVRRAAEHARSVLESASALNGESVSKTTWITAR
jgi:hypothetical protein